jgi:uncharacterized protein YjbJ (UPF0337 family)
MNSVTQKKWEGRWEQLKGKVKKIWADITDDELLHAQGNYDQLVGLLKTRTGETQEAIEEKLNREVAAAHAR